MLASYREDCIVAGAASRKRSILVEIPRIVIECATMIMVTGIFMIGLEFVGPSAAGKSTFVDLPLGLLTPSSGEVFVDGWRLSDLATGWQPGVGVVSQEPYIFNDSILRNVVLFAGTADEGRVVKVLEEVGLWELVQRPLGGSTPRLASEDRPSAAARGSGWPWRGLFTPIPAFSSSTKRAPPWIPIVRRW